MVSFFPFFRSSYYLLVILYSECKMLCFYCSCLYGWHSTACYKHILLLLPLLLLILLLHLLISSYSSSSSTSSKKMLKYARLDICSCLEDMHLWIIFPSYLILILILFFISCLLMSIECTYNKGSTYLILEVFFYFYQYSSV